MPGLAHLYIGQEAVAVGVCAALRRTTTSPAPTAGTATAWPRAPRRPDVRRAARQGGRLLPRQRRIDAHRRPGARQPRRERDRRRQRGIATGAASRRRCAERAGRRLLLRRGRARAGPALRGHEHGLALEAACRLRLREQPLQRVHALSRDHRRQRTARAEAFGIPAADRRRPGRARRARRGRRRSSGRARGDGPGFLVCETYRYPATTSATSTARTTAPARRRALARRARPARPARRLAREQGLANEDDLAAIETRCAAAVEAGVAFAWPRRSRRRRGGEACLRLAPPRACEQRRARADVRPGRQRGAAPRSCAATDASS